MLEFLKKFFKKLFGKDTKLIEETTENSNDIVEENDDKKVDPNADLPPIDDDTDIIEYIDDLIKQSPNYDRYLLAKQSYEEAEREYQQVIEEEKKAQQ